MTAKEPVNFNIEVAISSDESAINEVLEASFSSLLNSKYDDVLIATILPNVTRINSDLLNSGTYYIAKNESGEILGCGGWAPERPRTKDIITGEAHIRHFATHPKHIGYGVAKALYNTCKIAASKESVTHFECYSTLNAEHFYKSLSFESVKTFDLNMGDGLMFPSVLMKANV